MIKSKFKGKLGRKFKIDLIEQISITIFKLKYDLPDRILEDIFKIVHVTISSIINRISLYLARFTLPNTEEDRFYIVDSTTIRIGKGKNNKTYSGYKHHHGVKFQVVINDKNYIKAVSKAYPSSIHDKKIFLSEYSNLTDKINRNLSILGDKAYVGLFQSNIEVPSKRNEFSYKKDKNKAKIENKNLSSKRIKIEHIFAKMKNFRILKRLNYYKIHKIEIFFNAIANIYNLSKG